MSNKEREKMMQRRQSAKEWAQQQATGGFEATSIQTPPDYKFVKMEEGVLSLDIIPYVAGWGNRTGDEGFLVWQRQYHTHRIPRPNGDSQPFVCLWETFKKPCCVCKKLSQPGISEEMKLAMRSQQRHLMIVNDQPGKKLDPPFKLLDAVYYNRKLGFGEQLFMTIQSWPGNEDFFDFENGLTLKVQVSSTKYKQVGRIDFTKRGYNYDPDLLKQMPCLDDCILVPLPKSLKERSNGQPMSHFLSTFTDKDWALVNEGLQKILDGGDVADLDVGDNGHTTYSLPPKQEELPHHPTAKQEPRQEPRPEPKPAAKAVTAEEAGFAVGDTVNHDGHEKKVIQFSKDGTVLFLEDMDGDIGKAKVTEVEKVASKPAPAKAGKKPLPDDDDDDLDFDDDDE